MTGGKVSFRVGNQGNAHARISKLRLVAKNGAKTLHSQDLDGWYVLSGGARRYDVPLPPDVCAETSFVEVVLEAESGPVRQVLTGRCLP
jgi:hypothetical protein